MAKYLIRASYTQEGVKGLLKDGGSKRLQAVKDALQPMGCKVDAMYFAFGDDDVYVIVDAPDSETMTAVALATSASGSVRVKTTVLLTPEQVDAAVKKSISYRPPGK